MRWWTNRPLNVGIVAVKGDGKHTSTFLQRGPPQFTVVSQFPCIFHHNGFLIGLPGGFSELICFNFLWAEYVGDFEFTSKRMCYLIFYQRSNFVFCSAALIRGNRNNCTQFSRNLDWLVSKLERMESSSGCNGILFLSRSWFFERVLGEISLLMLNCLTS